MKAAKATLFGICVGLLLVGLWNWIKPLAFAPKEVTANPSSASQSAFNPTPDTSSLSGTSQPSSNQTTASSGNSSLTLAPGLEPSPTEATADLEKVGQMITAYHTRMGENPVGTNAEIMQTLRGQNHVGANFASDEGLSFNSKGELLDPWGTPYFFHQLTADHMEIRSAGPDKIMGTIDDLVLH